MTPKPTPQGAPVGRGSPLLVDLAVAALGVGVMVAAVAWSGLRPDLRYLSLGERLGVPAVMVLLSTAGHLGRRGSRLANGLFLGVALGLVVGLAGIEPGLRHASVFADWRCLPFGVLVAGVALLPSLARGWGELPWLQRASLGAAAGALAVGSLHLRCALASPGHVLGTHTAVVVIAAVAAARWPRPAAPR